MKRDMSELPHVTALRQGYQAMHKHAFEQGKRCGRSWFMDPGMGEDDAIEAIRLALRLEAVKSASMLDAIRTSESAWVVDALTPRDLIGFEVEAFWAGFAEGVLRQWELDSPRIEL